jgi:hypothetical protein
MSIFQNPGLTGSPALGRSATVRRTRVPGSQMQLPGFEAAGGPAVRPSHSVPKRRAMGGTTAGTARVSGQRFLPGFNPANAPGSGRDMKRTQMTPKRMAGIDAARARQAAKKLGGVDTGMMHGPSIPANKMKMSSRSLMGIGLGLGVAAGVAMNRRGEGASSGRQSMYKY